MIETPATMHSAGRVTEAGGAPRWLRIAGMSAGVVLLCAALWMVWRQRETLIAARNAIGSMPAGRLWLYVSMAIGSVAVNVVLSALLFSALMSRYGKVGLIEMQALIGTATLMN